MLPMGSILEGGDRMDKVVDGLLWALFGAAMVCFYAHLSVHGQDYLNDLIPWIDQVRRVF